jgi:hypothetical protein
MSLHPLRRRAAVSLVTAVLALIAVGASVAILTGQVRKITGLPN